MAGRPEVSGREQTDREALNQECLNPKGPNQQGPGRTRNDRQGSRRGSQAALYGIHATFRNRGNVKKLVESLLVDLYS